MTTYTTNWQISALGGGGFQPIDETSLTQKHELGTIVTAIDRGSNANGVGEFVYAKGVGSTVAGSWVTFHEDDWSTTLLAANDIGRVGIAMSANVAGPNYGWYQIGGKAVGKALTGFADNGLVFATSTAGSIDDAVVAGDRVKKAIGASALDGPATGMAEFELDRPFMDDATAA
jgi:hypothetical protein